MAMSTPVKLAFEPESMRFEHPSYMIEVSTTGLRLKANVPLTARQTIEVIPDGGPRYAVPCRVVWVREGEAGLEVLRLSAEAKSEGHKQRPA